MLAARIQRNEQEEESGTGGAAVVRQENTGGIRKGKTRRIKEPEEVSSDRKK